MHVSLNCSVFYCLAPSLNSTPDKNCATFSFCLANSLKSLHPPQRARGCFGNNQSQPGPGRKTQASLRVIYPFCGINVYTPRLASDKHPPQRTIYYPDLKCNPATAISFIKTSPFHQIMHISTLQECRPGAKQHNLQRIPDSF